MIQPPELTSDQPLLWSPGVGTDVWAMLVAAAAGDVPAVERLLDKDPSLARCTHAYRPVLSFAVRENRIEVARLLLARGARAHERVWAVGGPETVLDMARDRGLSEMERLLKAALPGGGDTVRGDSIAAAIRERDPAAIRRLLDAAPDLVHAVDERSNQPIHWAAMTRQLDVIDDLVDRGADVNVRRADGARPIQLARGDYHYRGWRKDFPTTFQQVIGHLRDVGAYCDICTASYVGDLARVRELLEQDPSLVNRLDEYVAYACSGAPLRNAAEAGHREIVELLLERGADPNLREEGAPYGYALYAAVTHRHFHVARMLLEHGACPNQEQEGALDALSIAISHGDQEMVDLLCSYGAASRLDILAPLGDVRTAAAVFAARPELADDPVALCMAVGNEAFVRLMLRHCPDLPRRVGVAGGTRAITEFLLQHGMDPSHPDWLHITPLHRVAAEGDIENAAIFIDRGADLHARDEEMRSTPLGYAAKYGRRRMVVFLLRRGARPDLPDDPRWATPMAWAKRRGHEEVAGLLAAVAAGGALPAPPTIHEYERLADDLAAAYRGRDDAAGVRVADYFDFGPAASNAGRSATEEVRLRVRGRPELRRPGIDPEEITADAARTIVARWDGFRDWGHLRADTRRTDGSGAR